MRKFIYKCVLFMLIIIVAVLGINTIYIEKENNTDTDKFNAVPQSVEICNFGSSHGAFGFNYSDITDYSCFNFGLTAQVLSYDYRILYNYRSRISKDAVVFIPISYFSFWIDETASENFASKNKRYYKFLPNELIKNYNIKTGIYERYFPALTAYWGLPRILFARKTTGIIPEIKAASKPDVKAQAMWAYKEHIESCLNEQRTLEVNEEELNALYCMIDLCKELGAEPILITTPYLSEYTEVIDEMLPEFYTEFYRIINKVKTEKNVIYYDFARDERFCSDYALFLDVDHLNEYGAKKFVKILMEEVVENGKIRKN